MRKIALLLAVLMFSTASVFAQSIVKGKVTDSKDGSPLSSISVKVKGTDIGTSTNPDGSFSIDIGKKLATLEFSGVGYASKSVKVTAGESVSVSLDKETKNLSEVVVTALGIKRERRSLAYATQTVGSDEINKSGSGNPLSELEGKVSGLEVINSSGDPGAGTYMQLRGVTSLTGNNQPLIVVDGVPIDNSINQFQPVDGVNFTASNANGNETGGTQATNRGLDINPNDIESITVLKGPAATALYGINAASGAIIITTKKGTPGQGKINVDVNSSMTFDRYNQLPALQNQFSQGSADPVTGLPVWVGPDHLYGDGTTVPDNAGSGAAKVSWGPAIDTLFWTGIKDDYSKIWDSHGRIVGKSSPLANLKMPVTPYNQYNFFQTGLTFNNNVAFSGGDEKSSYRASLGNLNQKGIIPNSQYNKTTFDISGQTKVSEKFNISSSINFITSATDKTQQGSNVSGVMLGLVRTAPTFDNANGLSDPANNVSSYVQQNGTGNERDYRGGVGYDNPYWTVNRNPFHENLDRAIGNLQANYQLLNWMTLTYRLGGDIYSQADKNSYDINSNAFPAGAVYEADYESRQFNSDFTVNMQKSFSKDFSGSLLLGQNYYYLYQTHNLASGSGLAVPTFFDMSNATSYQNLEGEGGKKTSAFYGDAQLNYKKMLYLELTGREEESSTLPETNNTFFYPSASLGWIFTELESLKNSNTLSYGKVRVSFAQVGKDAPIQSLQTYYLQGDMTDGFTTGVQFPINGLNAFQLSSLVSVIGNPDLKPENTNSYEFGTDLGFFKNRINFSGTYYYSKTSQAIFSVPIPFSSGFAAEEQNAGVLTNQGIELTLNTTPVKTSTGFRWDLNFNWSRNINKVISLANGVQQLFLGGFTNGGIYAVAGQPYGEIYGSAFQRSTTNGNTILIDDNKTDGGYGMPVVSSQTRALGNIAPDWIGSVINNFSYKGFTLGFQIDWRHGGKLWNGTRGAIDYFGTGEATANRGQSTVFKGVLGHVAGDGSVAHFDGSGNEVSGPGATNTVTSSYSQYYWQNIGSSFVGPIEPDVEDASFIKLRQVSLTYELPKSLIKNAGFKSISLTAFANNIILWTPYTGVDPETSLAGPSNAQGSDYFNNPSTKNFGLRLNLGL